jgi:hypothetical protein
LFFSGDEIVTDENPQIQRLDPAANAAAPAGPKPTPPAPAAHAAPPAPPKRKKAEGILVKKPGQWVCTVKDEKGRNCEGKLKRYYEIDVSMKRRSGHNVELYRCMVCRSLYRPENIAHDPAAPWSEV